MVIFVIDSTTSGKPLLEENLQKTLDDYDRALSLDATKKFLDFMKSIIGYITPNLSAIIGSAYASKLMGTAGGLSLLAKLIAYNVQLLGVKKKNLATFFISNSYFYVEHTTYSEDVWILIVGKLTLTTRVDSIRGNPNGKTRRDLREEICNKIEKWGSPPIKQPKLLLIPNFEPQNKRGDHRLCKMKESYDVIDLRNLANQMQFGIPKEISLGYGLG
eukprot:Gb_10304 [translate_table: standard]